MPPIAVVTRDVRTSSGFALAANHRYCPTCGKKRTDQWIENLRAILPQNEWQHITFTMPDDLWPIFQQNRHLLKTLDRLAATPLLALVAGKGCTPGGFSALHTFGRDLKWNPHVHLSVSRGGLTEQRQWQAIFFKKPHHGASSLREG